MRDKLKREPIITEIPTSCWLLIYFGLEPFDDVDSNGHFDTEKYTYIELRNSMDFYVVEAYKERFYEETFGYSYLPDTGQIIYGLVLAISDKDMMLFDDYLMRTGVQHVFVSVNEHMSLSRYSKLCSEFYRHHIRDYVQGEDANEE